jgi:hypothetical protein
VHTGQQQRKERSVMMNLTGGWMEGGIVIWTVIGIAVGVLLIMLISRMFKKK